MMKRPCASWEFRYPLYHPQNDGGQGSVCFSTNTDIHIIFNLPIQNIGVRALGCQKQMDAKSTSLPGQSSKDSFRFFRYFLCVLWSFRPYPAFPQPRRTLQRFSETPVHLFPVLRKAAHIVSQIVLFATFQFFNNRRQLRQCILVLLNDTNAAPLCCECFSS